jgi:MraZ protein
VKWGKVVNIPKLWKTVFKGQFTYSIDSKSRISIPAKIRKHISPDANDTIVMTKGLSSCIDLYPLDEWQKIEEKLLKKESEV